MQWPVSDYTGHRLSVAALADLWKRLQKGEGGWGEAFKAWIKERVCHCTACNWLAEEVWAAYQYDKVDKVIDSLLSQAYHSFGYRLWKDRKEEEEEEKKLGEYMKNLLTQLTKVFIYFLFIF